MKKTERGTVKKTDDGTKAQRVTDETEVGTTEMAMVLGVTARRV